MAGQVINSLQMKSSFICACNIERRRRCSPPLTVNLYLKRYEAEAQIYLK